MFANIWWTVNTKQYALLHITSWNRYIASFTQIARKFGVVIRKELLTDGQSNRQTDKVITIGPSLTSSSEALKMNRIHIMQHLNGIDRFSGEATLSKIYSLPFLNRAPLQKESIHLTRFHRGLVHIKASRSYLE